MVYKRFHRFEILDDVFAAFLESNSRGYDMKKISELGMDDVPRKTYLRYEHLSIPYRATMFFICGSKDVWLNLKLCNNGFVYSSINGKKISRHKYDSWVCADNYVSKDMSKMVEAFRQAGYTTVTAFYSFEEERLDIKVYRNHEDGPNLIVTYEPGYPDYDEEVMPHRTGFRLS